MPKINMQNKPFGVTGLYIHGNQGMTGDDRIPHVHLYCYGQRVEFSLIENDIKLIKGELDVTKLEEVIEWIKSNFSVFQEIWNTHSE